MDELTPAEKKKRAKEEKQARRAAEKAAAGLPATPAMNGEASNASRAQQAPRSQPPSQSNGAATAQQRGAGSTVQPMPLRRRLSNAVAPPVAPKVPKQESKQVDLFSHLYAPHTRPTLASAPKDIHPAVLALGFQMSSYTVCGSTARCVAMLLAFKTAIESYTTPTGTSLARHMTTHFLSPQIEFLKSCRPISESMGNAIRFLKKKIVEIDPAVEEGEAKQYLAAEIDRFLHERITATDAAIASAAATQIKPNAVILTYAKSSLVEKTLLDAHAGDPESDVAPISFRVICVDSRPLREGRNLARGLERAGVEVNYVPLSGIAHAMKEATLVLLGARSMLSDGRLVSRVGTAGVAMHASRADVPVIVLCESVKFSGKVALDSVVLNEIAPSEELILPVSEVKGDDSDGKTRGLGDWRDIKGLQMLNLMYDVTPAEYIRTVVSEFGSLPPSSVPVVHRLANEGI